MRVEFSLDGDASISAMKVSTHDETI